MAKIFVALNNFCRLPNNYTAMPPFYESFLTGLKDAGNTVWCYQTKYIAGTEHFTDKLPVELARKLVEFSPDLCILFNNNFWDISDVVECPIVIYDVDSPLEWRLKDRLEENVDRYLFVYNQTKGIDEIRDLFHPDERNCCFIPFFSEIQCNPETEVENNIVFLGTNWLWKGYNFLNNFMKGNPSKEDIQKAREVIMLYEKEPLKPAHELYYELKNCPHQRINLGNLSRASFEISGLKRIRNLQAVADLGLEVVGYYWDIDAMNYFPELLSCVSQKKIWTKQETEDYYNAALIALNSSHIQAENGFSFRVCDIMASNACLVTEKSADIQERFSGINLPMYTSPAEVREQCLRLLKNENLRRDIVAAVHERIDENYRFKNVLERLENFTELNLHSDEPGSLDITPKTAPAAKSEKPVPAAKNVTNSQSLSPLRQLYYNTLGKHLGYDPYHLFEAKYIYLGRLKFFKLLKISDYRKEVYWGFFPLVSYSHDNGASKISLLILEKIKNGFKAIKGKRPKKNKAKGKKEEVSKAKISAANQSVSPSGVSDPEANKSISLLKKDRAHLIKEKWESGEPIKIVLFVSRISCWMFEDIYKYLQNSGKFLPIIVVKPFLSRGVDHMKECMTQTYNALVERGYSPIKGYDEDTDTYFDVKNVIDPDIVFYTKFWKPHFHELFYIDQFRDRYTLLIDYGFAVADHPEAMNFELQNDVDIYFYYSPIQKEVAKRYMKNKAKNVVISGSPKLDRIFDEAYIPVDVWKPQGKNKKRIIWAPHHEDKTKPPQYQFDAFYDLHEIMFEVAEKYRDEIQIAFKPHPLLRLKLYNYWGEEATEEYYSRWAELDNGQLEEGEFVDLFLTSDAMILDSISFIAEYSATGKPSLFTIGSHTRVKLNDLGMGLYNLMYHADKNTLKEDICMFIENVVINENDMFGKLRKKYVQENILPPNEKPASENVFDSICELIENEGLIQT